MEGGIMDTVVKVDLSFTRNLGNYESIKIGIGVEDFVRSGETLMLLQNECISLLKISLLKKLVK